MCYESADDLIKSGENFLRKRKDFVVKRVDFFFDTSKVDLHFSN